MVGYAAFYFAREPAGCKSRDSKMFKGQRSNCSTWGHYSERYRDLIGAADCIVRMKETAFAVQDNISKMRNSCDIHALKRNVAAKTKKAQSGSMGKENSVIMDFERFHGGV